MPRTVATNAPSAVHRFRVARVSRVIRRRRLVRSDGPPDRGEWHGLPLLRAAPTVADDTRPPRGPPMSAPATSLRSPALAQEADHRVPVKSSEGLERSLGTFTLMMFGVGSTVGTGVFFVMHEAVPDAGPAVIVSFVLAGHRGGPVGAVVRRDGVGGPRLRVHATPTRTRRSARWSRWASRRACCSSTASRRRPSPSGGAATSTSCCTTCSGSRSRTRCPPHRGTPTPGSSTCRRCSWSRCCALLLIRGASESAKVNATMVVIKLAVLLMFVAIAFTGFHSDNFADFAPKGIAGITAAAGHDLLHVHRPRRRLDGRRRGARPAEDDAAGHPRRARRSSRRSTSSSPSPPWARSRGRSSATPRRARPVWPRSCRTWSGRPGPARSCPPARSSRSSR